MRKISGAKVLVKVTYPGLCGTDTHDRASGCGLGHEGVGIIEKVGKEVTAVKICQRAGRGLVAFPSMININVSINVCVGGNSQYAIPRYFTFPNLTLEQSRYHCQECVSGYRQYCPESCRQKYGELEQGAFGDYVVKHQDLVHQIPDKIDSKHAGPLNCAGVGLSQESNLNSPCSSNLPVRLRSTKHFMLPTRSLPIE